MNAYPSPATGRTRASALVVTLAFVIILTILLLAYFNVVTTDRLATRNYAQGMKAETVAQGAADFVIGQLRSEMAQGAAPLPVGDYKVYTNVTSTNVLPQRIGTNTGVPILIKMPGGGQGVFSNSTQTAATADSSVTSANNRKISQGRWNRVALGQATASPHWFLLGSRGITNTPSTGVEGRFAFAIYDIGSLLDINVAGFPSTLSAAQKKSLGGTLAGLELGTLGMNSSAVDELIVGFRNRTSAANYTNHVREAATNGFVRVSPGDDAFLSRQDLLAYAKWKGFSDAATNLTTFARTVNAPAWSPATNAGTFNIQAVTRANIVAWNPRSGASTASQPADVSYRDKSAQATATNRAFLTQAATGTFSRLDGATAKVGEPLVISRFPLERLEWLSKDGPSQKARDLFGSAAAAAAKIKAAFGLVWDNANRLWVYTSPTASNGGGTFSSGNSDGPASSGKAASTIKTLAVAASENREPDFFELLQAGILKGSLGEHSSIVNPNSIPQPGEVTPQGHIFQIGANIIDQYDADDFPTLVRAYMPAVMDGSEHAYDRPTTTSYVIGNGTAALTPHDFAGVENLPYLMSLRTRAFRPQVGNSTDGTRRFGQGILMPQFWNPHRNASNPSTDRPPQLRIIQTFGDIRMAFMGRKRGSTVASVYLENGELYGYMGYVTSPPSEWPSTSGAPQPMIEFSSTAAFAQPGFLRPADVTATSIPQNIQTALTADAHTRADVDPTGFVGFWLGGTPYQGTEYVAMDPTEEDDDNTPIDREVWAKFTGSAATSCPVQQYIVKIATPTSRNATPLPASDRFWKGDSALAATSIRYPVFELQYLDGTLWKTYQRFDGVLRGGGDDHKDDTLATTFPSQYAASFTSESHAAMYGRIDPRGSRLGLVRMADPAALYNGDWNGNPQSYRNVPMAGVVGTTGRPNGEASVNFNGTLLPGNQGGAEFSATFDPSSDATRWINYNVSEWQNNRSSGQRYTDNDRIPRRGDGDTSQGIDVLSSSGTARPLMLNRPFQTPADLGYVHRDLPFKTLDFFSANSADAGLLELFSVTPSPRVAAGRLNLNGQNAAVLKQVLTGATVDEITQTTLSAAEAQPIIGAITARTSTNAFTGIWDLPTFLESTSFQTAAPGALGRMKTQAESVSRRLASVSDTRCWNLLVDIVAQTGRYAPGITDPNRFTVEGERRYWLQIAIDRFTGEVVSRQWEPVYE